MWSRSMYVPISSGFLRKLMTKLAFFCRSRYVAGNQYPRRPTFYVFFIFIPLFANPAVSNDLRNLLSSFTAVFRARRRQQEGGEKLLEP